MNISVMPSALGTSNLIPYLPCVILTSGVTSQPRRLMWCTGSAPWAASSRDLYKVRWRSRHVNQNCFGCFSVNRFGLNTKHPLLSGFILKYKTENLLVLFESQPKFQRRKVTELNGIFSTSSKWSFFKTKYSTVLCDVSMYVGRLLSTKQGGCRYTTYTYQLADPCHRHSIKSLTHSTSTQLWHTS
jgi:hypothetical protein